MMKVIGIMYIIRKLIGIRIAMKNHFVSEYRRQKYKKELVMRMEI